ncbi:MAG: hypothetical protein R3E55_08335 [Burkholderiaceae bacterium]
MTYPIILLVVAVLWGGVAVGIRCSSFEIFDSMGDALPYSTQLAVNLSDSIRSHWMLILLRGRVFFCCHAGWLPQQGACSLTPCCSTCRCSGVVKNSQFAVYFRTFGILLQRGVPMAHALRIAVDTLTNVALRKDIESLVGIVKQARLQLICVTHFKRPPPPN